MPVLVPGVLLVAEGLPTPAILPHRVRLGLFGFDVGLSVPVVFAGFRAIRAGSSRRSGGAGAGHTCSRASPTLKEIIARPTTFYFGEQQFIVVRVDDGNKSSSTFHGIRRCTFQIRTCRSGKFGLCGVLPAR